MQIKTSIIPAAALGASLLLAACNTKPETVVAGDPVDPDAAALNAAAPVELPPMVTASRTYRCKDNSVVYIDFFSNNTAHYKTVKTGTPTVLTAPAAGEAFTAAGGYTIKGSGPTLELTAPGKGTQSCKA